MVLHICCKVHERLQEKQVRPLPLPGLSKIALIYLKFEIFSPAAFFWNKLALSSGKKFDSTNVDEYH